MRSDSVVLPESIWALMPMLRMRSVFATSSFSLGQGLEVHSKRAHDNLRGALHSASFGSRSVPCPAAKIKQAAGREVIAQGAAFRGHLMPPCPFRFGAAAGRR